MGTTNCEYSRSSTLDYQNELFKTMLLRPMMFSNGVRDEKARWINTLIGQGFFSFSFSFFFGFGQTGPCGVAFATSTKSFKNRMMCIQKASNENYNITIFEAFEHDVYCSNISSPFLSPVWHHYTCHLDDSTTIYGWDHKSVSL